MKIILIIIGLLGALILIVSGGWLLISSFFPDINRPKTRYYARIAAAISFLLANSAIFLIQHVNVPSKIPSLNQQFECSKGWTSSEIKSKTEEIAQPGYIFRNELSSSSFSSIGVYYNLTLPESTSEEKEVKCKDTNGSPKWLTFSYDQHDYNILICTKTFKNEYLLATTDFSLILRGSPITLLLVDTPDNIYSLFKELPCFLDSLRFS